MRISALMIHMTGALELLKLREPLEYATPAGRAIVRNFRNHMVKTCTLLDPRHTCSRANCA